jgi:hypothetical protein
MTASLAELHQIVENRDPMVHTTDHAHPRGREEISSNAQYSEQQDNAEAKQRDHDETKALKLASKVGSVGAQFDGFPHPTNPARERG